MELTFALSLSFPFSFSFSRSVSLPLSLVLSRSARVMLVCGVWGDSDTAMQAPGCGVLPTPPCDPTRRGVIPTPPCLVPSTRRGVIPTPPCFVPSGYSKLHKPVQRPEYIHMCWTDLCIQKTLVILELTICVKSVLNLDENLSPLTQTTPQLSRIGSQRRCDKLCGSTSGRGRQFTQKKSPRSAKQVMLCNPIAHWVIVSS